MDTTEILKGDSWLGHPVHPLLVAGPIGMWVFSAVLDGMASVTRNECAQEASNYAITTGLVVAGFAAATGLAEYSKVPRDEQAQSKAFTHGALNATATALFGVNAALRANRRRGRKSVGLLPKMLSLAGVGLLTYTGWLGGSLAYNHGVGVHLDEALASHGGQAQPEPPAREEEQAPAEGKRRSPRSKVTS